VTEQTPTLQQAILAATAGIMLYDRDLWSEDAQGLACAAVEAAWSHLEHAAHAKLQQLEQHLSLAHKSLAPTEGEDGRDYCEGCGQHWRQAAVHAATP
jgi:hypothetical protein